MSNAAPAPFPAAAAEMACRASVVTVSPVAFATEPDATPALTSRVKAASRVAAVGTGRAAAPARGNDVVVPCALVWLPLWGPPPAAQTISPAAARAASPASASRRHRYRPGGAAAAGVRS